MSCKCSKCKKKLEEADLFYESKKHGHGQQGQYGQEPKPRSSANVYGYGSNGYSHIHSEKQRSGSLHITNDVVSIKPVESIDAKKREEGSNSNSAILETGDSLTLKPGQVIKFKKGISGSDNHGNVIISADGESIIVKSKGMYRFVLTFAVENSAPNSIFISLSKSNPDHFNFQTLTVYNDGVNICSTILPIKPNTEIKLRNPGGKDRTDINFVGPVRLELYEV